MRRSGSKLAIAAFALAGLSVLPLAASCGSSAGIGIGIATLGLVTSPKGEIAQVPTLQQRFAALFQGKVYADVQGLDAVVDVEVELVQVDDEGNFVKVLETVRTDNEGFYEFKTPPADNQVVRVQGISGEELNALVGTGQTDVSPVSEFVFQEAIDSTQAIGGSIVDLTLEERDAIEAAALALDFDLTGADDIADALSDVDDQQNGALKNVIDDLSPPGSNAARLTDKWTFLGMEAILGFGVEGGSFTGSVDFDGKGRFTAQEDIFSFWFIQNLGGAPDDENFDSADSDGGDGSGGYAIFSDGRIVVTDDAEVDSFTGDVLAPTVSAGAVSEEDNLMFLVSTDDDSELVDLTAVVKRGKGIKESDLDGRFHHLAFEFAAVDEQNADIVLDIFHIFGTADFDGVGGVTLTEEEDDRNMTFPPNSVINAFGGQVEITDATYTVDADGDLTIDSTDPDSDFTISGVVGDDKQFAVMSINIAEGAESSRGLSFLIEEADAASNATANGEYTAVGMVLELDANSDATILVESQLGTFTFDGNGNATYDFEFESFTRDLNDDGNTGATSESGSDGFSFTTTIDAKGKLTIDDVNPDGLSTTTGAISADGNFFVVRLAKDQGGETATRGLILGMKKRVTTR